MLMRVSSFNSSFKSIKYEGYFDDIQKRKAKEVKKVLDYHADSYDFLIRGSSFSDEIDEHFIKVYVYEKNRDALFRSKDYLATFDEDDSVTLDKLQVGTWRFPNRTYYIESEESFAECDNSDFYNYDYPEEESIYYNNLYKPINKNSGVVSGNKSNYKYDKRGEKIFKIISHLITGAILAGAVLAMFSSIKIKGATKPIVEMIEKFSQENDKVLSNINKLN